VVPIVGLPHVVLADVGVDLRGRDVGVAEQGLDGAQVGAALEQVGGEAVAELVRRDGAGDAGRDRVLAEFLEEALTRQRPPRLVEEDQRADALAGGQRGRPSRSQACRAATAGPPSGTRRGLSPLPISRTTAWSR
jgi:hypothetical protein